MVPLVALKQSAHITHLQNLCVVLSQIAESNRAHRFTKPMLHLGANLAFGCLPSLPSLSRFKSLGKYGLALRNFTVIHYRLVPPTRSEVILFNVVLELLSPVGLFLWMGGKQPASWYPFGISPIARHSLSFTIKPVNILLGKCT